MQCASQDVIASGGGTLMIPQQQQCEASYPCVKSSQSPNMTKRHRDAAQISELTGSPMCFFMDWFPVS